MIDTHYHAHSNHLNSFELSGAVTENSGVQTLKHTRTVLLTSAAQLCSGDSHFNTPVHLLSESLQSLKKNSRSKDVFILRGEALNFAMLKNNEYKYCNVSN